MCHTTLTFLFQGWKPGATPRSTLIPTSKIPGKPWRTTLSNYVFSLLIKEIQQSVRVRSNWSKLQPYWVSTWIQTLSSNRKSFSNGSQLDIFQLCYFLIINNTAKWYKDIEQIVVFSYIYLARAIFFVALSDWNKNGSSIE